MKFLKFFPDDPATLLDWQWYQWTREKEKREKERRRREKKEKLTASNSVSFLNVELRAFKLAV